MKMNEQAKKLIDYNKVFVDNELYLKYTTSKYPERKIAILSCMDTRMTELLPAALGLKNGDVKSITNAGAVIKEDFGSIAYSLIVAIYELGVDTIFVIGHDDCGVKGLDGDKIVEKMLERGIEKSTLDAIETSFMPIAEWLSGFDEIEESVRHTVERIEKHELIPADVEVYGFVMNPETGEIKCI